MNRFSKRMWGSDVIASLYALAALFLLGQVFRTSGILQIIAVLGIAYFSVASVGLFFRINAIRVGVVWLLGLSIVGDVCFSLFLAAVLLGWVKINENTDSGKQLQRSLARAGGMGTIVFYLLGAQVRAEYVRKRNDETPDDDQPWEDLEEEPV